MTKFYSRTALTLLFSITSLSSFAADTEKNFTCYWAGEYACTLSELTALADQGEPSEQYRIGQIYQDGRGVTKNYQEAMKWYRKAADNSHLHAHFAIAEMYGFGYGVTKDDALAEKWLYKGWRSVIVQ